MFDVSSPRTWAAVATIVATPGLSCARRSAWAAATSASSSSPAASAMRASGYLVGHVDREERQDRGALLLTEGTQRRVRGPGIAAGHGQQGEEPYRLAAVVRRGVLEQGPRELSRSLLQAPVALMQRDSPQGDDSGGVERADEAIAGLRTELPFENRAGVGQPTQLVQLPSPPDLEDADGPRVAVALCGGDAVGGQPE